MDITTSPCYSPEKSGSAVSTKGDVDDEHGDVVDELTRRLPRSVRERAEQRDAVARARLGLERAPAPSQPAPRSRIKRTAPPRGERVKIAAGPIRTNVRPRTVTLEDLEPETRARAERLLAVIPHESAGAETQACLVALTLARRAS